MSQVALTFLANGESADRVISGLERKILSLENRLKHTLEETRKGNKDAVAGWDAMGNAIGGVLAPLASASAAIGVFRKEYDDLLARQEKAKTSNSNFAGSFRGAFLALGQDDTIKTAAELRSRIDAASEKTGALPKAVGDVFQDVFSARGNMTGEQAAQAAEAALSLVPNIEDAQRPLAGAALDFMKINPKASAESTLGFLMQLGTESRITSTRATAENAAPAVAAVIRGGASDQGAAALVSTMSQAMFDSEGRISGTASISLAQQLREFLPDKKSFEERLALVQKNEQARDVFLKGGIFDGKKYAGASFERKAENAVEALLSGKGEVAENFNEARRRMPALTGGGAIYDRLLAELDADPGQEDDLMTRRKDARLERARLRDRAGRQMADARGQLTDTLEGAGVGWFGRMAAGAVFDIRSFFTKKPYDAAASLLENRQQHEIFGEEMRNDPEIAKLMKESIDELKKMNAHMERNQKKPRVGGREE